MNKLETIQRIEKKYMLTKKQMQEILSYIQTYIQEDLYYNSHIYNIYLDDINYPMIYRSMEKPIYKEKMRMRSYKPIGLNGEEDVFLEIKKKYKDIVCKRRIQISLNQALAFMKGEYQGNNQIEKELSYCMNYHHVNFAVYIAYDRLSYVGIKEKDLRITFDTNIRGRFKHLSFQDEKDTMSLFDDEMVLMEIKAHGACPMWLVHTLSNMKIYPCSFSKVGKMMEKYRRLGGI